MNSTAAGALFKRRARVRAIQPRKDLTMSIFDNDVELIPGMIWTDRNFDAPTYVDDANDNWQVIYITPKGLDYCRETYPGGLSRTAIASLVKREISDHEHVAMAKIERW